MCKDETQVKLLLKKLHNFRPLLQEMLQVIEGWIRSVKFNTYIHIFWRTIFLEKTCLLKHEMALSTDGTESVCGENAFPPLLFTLYFT